MSNSVIGDTEWYAEYRTHPDAPWTSAPEADEDEARSWVRAWERGGVVVEARIIRKEVTIIESVRFPAKRLDTSDV